MSKTIKIFILLIVVVLVFNKQIISYALIYGFSKWTRHEITLDKLQINYIQSLITINGLRIKSPNEFYYDNIFESEKITLSYNPQSLLTNLITYNNLIIENPKFFVELIEESPKVYDDNISVAKKYIKNTPDKIWPDKDKKKDINFLILKTEIKGAKVSIKTSHLSTPTKIDLSDMYFNKIGNEKGYQHYKDVFKLIFFDMYARISDPKLKKLLKKTYID
jgi:hypothetical protein